MFSNILCDFPDFSLIFHDCDSNAANRQIQKDLLIRFHTKQQGR